MKSQIVLGWHFLMEDGKLGNNDGRRPRVGRWLTMREKGAPLMCERGMHASETPLDALNYAPGPIVCRVKVRGDIQHDTDKFVGRGRLVIAKADATLVLHEFALWCAERALRVTKMTDERCWNALKVKRAWLKGKASDEELSAAWSAALSAALSAAESAAESAEWSAAWSAARSAEWSAAWSAARSAAESAAWSAAWSAAESAAWSAAESAARSAQNKKLTQMFNKLLGIKS